MFTDASVTHRHWQDRIARCCNSPDACICSASATMASSLFAWLVSRRLWLCLIEVACIIIGKRYQTKTEGLTISLHRHTMRVLIAVTTSTHGFDHLARQCTRTRACVCDSSPMRRRRQVICCTMKFAGGNCFEHLAHTCRSVYRRRFQNHYPSVLKEFDNPFVKNLA